MGAESAFPKVLEFDGIIWHLTYDPACESTVQPNLAGSNVSGPFLEQVQMPGTDRPVFLVLLNIIFPARYNVSGQVIPERRMFAMRTYDHKPFIQGLQMLNPSEFVFYIAEPSNNGSGSVGQRLIDAIVGASRERMEKKEKVDSSWTKMFTAAEGEQGHVERTEQSD